MAGLPDGVQRLDEGGYRVAQRPAWRWVSRVLAVLLGVMGLAAAGLGILLLVLDVAAWPALLAGVVMLAAIPMLLRTGREQQAEHWIVDAAGLHVRGGVVASRSVPWEHIAALELHDRRARLGADSGYMRLVTLTAMDGRGNRLLQLPDENSPGRILAVFDAARGDRLVPPHVRFVVRA